MEIRIEHLNKNYGKHEVLKDICLTVPVGMYGLLGNNGAGKTTLMRILTAVSEPTSGNVLMNGIPLSNRKEIRRMTGYLPQDFSVYPAMSVYSALDYLGVLDELPAAVRKERIDTVLHQVNLEQEKYSTFRHLSGGMKRRFGIAQALLNDPAILIVDEPTAGLDPEERLRFYNLLSELAENRIILLSTHIAGDMEAVCSHIAVLHQGRIIFRGSVCDLLKEAAGKVYSAQITPDKIDVIKRQYEVISLHQKGTAVECRFLSDGIPPIKHNSCEPTVEDSYLYILGKNRGVE